MTDPEAIVRSLGGAAHIQSFEAAGFSRARIERDVGRGLLIRIRPGVVVLPTSPPDVVEAARLGGRVTGSSAARLHGLWARPGHSLTIEVRANAHSIPDPSRSSTRIVRAAGRRRLRDSLGVAPLGETLRQVIRSESPAYAVATLDSALRRTPISRIELAELEMSLPERLRWIVRAADGRSDSGTESVLRMQLAAVGIVAVPQVRIPLTDLDRLDLLVGDCLVIECDSDAHHGGREQRLKDLRRDAELAALGFIVLRFDYQQVMFDPNSVIAAVQRLVDLGLHLRQSR